jgi:hypothetical protein
LVDISSHFECQWIRETAPSRYWEGKEATSIPKQTSHRTWFQVPEQREGLDDSQYLSGLALTVGP